MGKLYVYFLIYNKDFIIHIGYILDSVPPYLTYVIRFRLEHIPNNVLRII